jgi:hypothetical protein
LLRRKTVNHFSLRRIFRQRALKCVVSDVHAAEISRLCESNGVYRGPAGTTFVFFTFGQVQVTKRA